MKNTPKSGDSHQKGKKEYFESYRIVIFTTVSKKGLEGIIQQMSEEKYTMKLQQLPADRVVLLSISHIRLIKTTEID